MGKQFKLPDIDFAKIASSAGRKSISKFIGSHKLELIAGFSLVVITTDDICVHLGRRKDQKAFAENASKQQQIIRKHEGEIRVLNDKADQAQEATQKVEMLAQIVNDMARRDVSE